MGEGEGCDKLMGLDRKVSAWGLLKPGRGFICDDNNSDEFLYAAR